MKPLTQEVLACINPSVVVVGSVANGYLNPKDIDCVVKSREMKNRNPLFEQLLKKYPNDCTSAIVGHLVVKAHPLCVELFEYDCYSTNDSQKDNNRTTYARAVRKAVKAQVMGVMMRIYSMKEKQE
jgi:hypothetical protein